MELPWVLHKLLLSGNREGKSVPHGVAENSHASHPSPGGWTGAKGKYKLVVDADLQEANGAASHSQRLPKGLVPALS